MNTNCRHELLFEVLIACVAFFIIPRINFPRKKSIKAEFLFNWKKNNWSNLVFQFSKFKIQSLTNRKKTMSL